ncbi:hypothetical protein D3C78_1303750 [compost metagenome]
MLTRPLQVGLGFAHGCLGGAQRGLGFILARRGEHTALDQLVHPPGLLAYVVTLRARRHQLCLGGIHRGGAGTQRLAGFLQPRFSLADDKLVGLRVDTKQHLASLHPGIVEHRNFCHATTHLGSHLHDIGLHHGLRRRGRASFHKNGEGKQHGDQHRHT